jgi:hypothetical protein
MGGPGSAIEALRWIKVAVREARYTGTKHLFERMALRRVSLLDVVTAIQRGKRAEPYSEPPCQGGTCWRVHGSDSDGRRLSVGVEAYLTDDGEWALLCTVFEEKRR